MQTQIAHPQGHGRSRTGGLAMGAGSVLFLTGVVVAATYFLRIQDASGSTETAAAASTATPSKAAEETAAPQAKPAAAAGAGSSNAQTESSLTLTFDGRSVTRRWKELGLGVGPDGESVLDRAVAEKTLTALRADLDRGPENARLDLEKRTIVDGKPGFGIDVIGSVSALEVAARAGAKEVALEGVEIPPSVTRKELGIDDVSVVISSFQTTFPVVEKSRSDNLKLVASHIDGLVLQPGQEFSFNKVVGDRTEKEGYKVAHVIEAGELVDGMAGGACQISTTLHGAVWFAGLDIVSATVHSRPSVYVPLGFDATVAWPNTDFVWKNSFSFPIAISYKVARGVARVEILGKEKVYDKVAFVREVEEEKPFDTITREDETIGMGYVQIDQPGFPGYKLQRIQQAFKDGRVARTDKWIVQYKPVVEYVRMGVNPDPNLPKPPVKKSHMPKPAKGQKFTMTQ